MVTERRFDKLIVHLAEGGNTHLIRVDAPKWTLKQEKNELTSSDRIQPYAFSIGKESYEIQFTDVDPEQYFIFDRIQRRQTSGDYRLPNIAFFSYDSKGKPQCDISFVGVVVEELSKEKADPFDVKMSALRRGT